MELAKQVTSLDISKKLSELGFRKDSLYWWSRQEGLLSKHEFAICRSDLYSESYRSYTASELMEYLPVTVNNRWLTIGKSLSGMGNIVYECYYQKDEDEYYRQKSDTLADALGQMLIYLLQNNLIDETILDKE